MALMTFTLAALAVYRLSRMLTDEEGPFMVFTKVRGLARPDTWIGRGLECILCMSVWVALAAALYIDPTWTLPLTWLALSSVTVLIRKWEQKR